MAALIDLTGRRFGRLLVLGRDDDKITPKGKRVTAYSCQCYCGGLCVVSSNDLRDGRQSCGCLGSRTRIGQRSRTHGDSKRSGSLYQTWLGIKRRCLDPNDAAYPKYGARGIGMHLDWQRDYGKFKSWIVTNLGLKPTHGHSLDRKNNDRGYEPGNLRWATQTQQARNSRATKLSEEDVRRIRLARNAGLTRSCVAAAFGVSRHAVTDIMKGRTWSDV